jgi:hypothetical protein
MIPYQKRVPAPGERAMRALMVAACLMTGVVYAVLFMLVARS